MAEPWLKYQTTDGPWTKYAKAAGTAVQAVGETAAVLATDVPATVTSGFTGIATGGDVGAMEAVKESLSYEPSEVGQKSMQRIGESIGEITKYLPLEEISDKWANTIVPALQEKMGVKEGAALAASMLGLVNAAAEFNPVTKTVKKGALPTDKGDFDNIRTYHGGHDFEKFSTDFMGAGSGKQIRGWGLYFGPEKKAKAYEAHVAKNNALLGLNGAITRKEAVEKAQGGELSPEMTDLILELDKQEFLGQNSVVGAIDSLMSNGLLGDIVREKYPDAAQAAKLGAMYKVELLGKQDEFMDWYEPLSKQSSIVKAGVKEAFESITSDPGQVEFLMAKFKNSPGKEVYQEIEKLLKSDKKASELLFASGIKGNKLASTVPDAQDFVAFNASIVDISRKYGIPLGLTTALLAAGAGQQGATDETL